MAMVFSVCAVIGGVIMVIQFLLTLSGLGGDHDVGGDHDFGVGGDHDFGVGGDHDFAAGGDHDFAAGGDHHLDAVHDHHDTAWFFGVLSFRALVAAVAFFGLGGLAAGSAGLTPYPSFLSAMVAGAAAMIVVAWLMRLLHTLGAEGNVNIEMAVGETATVYLNIPAQREGPGKVTVKVQDRTMEYQAVTSEHEVLKTGSQVRVVSVVTPDTVEVEALSE